MNHISEYDILSQKAPFKYKCLKPIPPLDFCGRVLARANNPRIIYQNDTPLCGPAAFLYCITKSNPNNYSQYIYNLALHGIATIGSMEIKPSKGCKNSDIPALKLILLIGLGLPA